MLPLTSLVTSGKSLSPNFCVCKMVAHSGSFIFLLNSCSSQDVIRVMGVRSALEKIPVPEGVTVSALGQIRWPLPQQPLDTSCKGSLFLILCVGSVPH